MSDAFQIQLIVRGPERTVETNYGPRQERDDLARIEVPAEGAQAWEILAYVVNAVRLGRLELRTAMTDEERDAVIEQMQKPLR